jgi:uncharacterized protein
MKNILFNNKFISKLLSLFLSFLFLFLFSASVYATKSFSSINDGANLLSDDEEAVILQKLDEFGSVHNFNMIILTTDSLSESVEDTSVYDIDYVDNLARIYSEKFYLSLGFNYDTDGLVFLRYINNADKYIRITSFGELKEIFDEKSSQKIIDRIVGDFAENSSTVDEGILKYISLAEKKYISRNDLSLETIIVLLIISLVVALIIVMSMKSKLKTVRSQPYAGNYIKQGSFDLTKSYDRYLYRTVTKVKIQSNSSGSRGGGSRSGGGGGRRA